MLTHLICKNNQNRQDYTDALTRYLTLRKRKGEGGRGHDNATGYERTERKRVVKRGNSSMLWGTRKRRGKALIGKEMKNGGRKKGVVKGKLKRKSRGGTNGRED